MLKISSIIFWIEEHSGLISLILTIFGILLAYLFYIKSRKQHDSSRDVKKPSKKELENQIEDQLNLIEDSYKSLNIPNVYTELTVTEIKPWKSSNQEENKESIIDISRLLETEHSIILIGDAGSGKTTTLRWLAKEYAKKYRARQSDIVPIYIDLTDCDKDYPFEENISNFSKITREVQYSLANKQQIFYLLDGLDNYSREHKEIRNFLRNMGKARFLISSRPNYFLDFENYEKNIKIFKLEPLNDSKRKKFIDNYITGENNQYINEKIDEDANLRDLCKNPLLLYIIIRIISNRERKYQFDVIPQTRTELFGEFILYLKQHAMVCNRTDPDPVFEGLPERFLSCISFLMQCNNESKISLPDLDQYTTSNFPNNRDKVLKFSYDTGLLECKGNDVFFGYHYSFKEYFAAIRLKKFFERRYDITPSFSHPNWESIVIMVSEITDEPDEFVDILQEKNIFLSIKCSKRASDDKKKYLLEKLLENTSSSRCEQEQRKYIEIIADLGPIGVNGCLAILFGNFPNETKLYALSVLGKIGSDAAIPHLIKYLADEDWFIRREAAVALAEIGSKATIQSLKKALSDENYIIRRGAAYALGEIKSDYATGDLVNALSDRKWYVRMGAAYALGKIGSDIAETGLIRLLSDNNGDVRRGAVNALGKIRSEVGIQYVIKALSDQDSSVQKEAVTSLGKVGTSSVILSLIKALSDEDPSARKNAADALGMIGSNVAVPDLIKALSDQEISVRRSAIDALGVIGCNTAIPDLTKALSNENRDVRTGAAHALGKIGNDSAVPDLIKALSDQEMSVRSSATDALVMIGSYVAVPELIKALSDDKWPTRMSAAFVLGKIGNDTVIPNLIKALSDEDWHVRSMAAFAIGWIGSDTAIPEIIKALSDESWDVRRGAAYALGEIGNSFVIPNLIKTLFDENWHVRRRGTYALGKIGNDSAVPDLIKALSDENRDVRRGAAYALGEIGSDGAIPDLIKALFDEDLFVRGDAGSALKKLCTSSHIHLLKPLLNQEDNPDIANIVYKIIERINIKDNQNKKLFKEYKMNCD